MKHPLVSIIIPTYNRACLIGETLDSVIAQTYQNWECIIVDDGSLDNTSEVVQKYLDKDPRFQYHHRPAYRPKGANACRNYGFEVSKGEYVNWFDSDDIMLPQNIDFKLQNFTENIDFVIGNSLNFDKNGVVSQPFQLDYSIPITADNFISQKIGWITNDVLIKRKAVVIKFNEALQSGQEYNFFSRLLYQTNRGKFVKKKLTHRRLHKCSISENVSQNSLFTNEFYLLNDIETYASSIIINRSLKRLIRFTYNLSAPFKLKSCQIKVLFLLGIHKKFVSLFYYLSWIMSNLIFGRGYTFNQQSIKKL